MEQQDLAQMMHRLLAKMDETQAKLISKKSHSTSTSSLSDLRNVLQLCQL
jgi:hypothetical protein